MTFCNAPRFSLRQAPAHATGRRHRCSRCRRPRRMPPVPPAASLPGARDAPVAPSPPTAILISSKPAKTPLSGAASPSPRLHNSPPRGSCRSVSARPCRLSTRRGGDAAAAGATPGEQGKTAGSGRRTLVRPARARGGAEPRCPRNQGKGRRRRRFSASRVPQRRSSEPPPTCHRSFPAEGRSVLMSPLLLTKGGPSSVAHARSVTVTRPRPQRTRVALFNPAMPPAGIPLPLPTGLKTPLEGARKKRFG